jgi:acyl carrier protein
MMGVGPDNFAGRPVRSEIIGVARDLIATELSVDGAALKEDAVLRELPGADSIHLLRVVARMERHYDVQFDDEDVFKVATLAEVADLVINQLKNE